jgi:multicomponent Na+:H+ antiporter subunit G
MSLLAALLITLGSVILVIAGWGVVTLPDALSRQHAATKAGTLALAMIALGAFVAIPADGFGVRLALILGFLIATLPVASHLLARAAIREQGIPTDDAPRIGDHRRDPEARPPG